MKYGRFCTIGAPVNHILHCHDSFECHLVISGNGQLILGQTKTELTSGSFVTIFPGHGHKLESLSAHERLAQLYFNFFPGEEDGSFEADLRRGLSNGKVYNVGNSRLAYFERLRTLALSPLMPDRHLADSYLRLFYYSLIRGGSPGQREERLSQLPPLIAALMREMYLRLAGSFSLKRFAERHETAPAVLTRTFRAIYGQAPYRYFQGLKVDAVCHYLENNAVTLDKAADVFGFSDQFHLSKMFTRVKGVSPRNYFKL
jgi:AraC-like DNA-binding protein